MKFVLLVENKAPLQRSLKIFLEKAGYTVDCCTTAYEAHVLAEKSRYDILIAEYHLPDANGTKLLEKLKPIMPDAAMIMISEYDFPVIANDVSHANVHFFLQKPFDLVDLENALSCARSIEKAACKDTDQARKRRSSRMPASTS